MIRQLLVESLQLGNAVRAVVDVHKSACNLVDEGHSLGRVAQIGSREGYGLPGDVDGRKIRSHRQGMPQGNPRIDRVAERNRLAARRKPGVIDGLQDGELLKICKIIERLSGEPVGKRQVSAGKCCVRLGR